MSHADSHPRSSACTIAPLLSSIIITIITIITTAVVVIITAATAIVIVGTSRVRHEVSSLRATATPLKTAQMIMKRRLLMMMMVVVVLMGPWSLPCTSALPRPGVSRVQVRSDPATGGVSDTRGGYEGVSMSSQPSPWSLVRCRLKRSGTPATFNINWESIDREWHKTRCVPREVCVDVARERAGERAAPGAAWGSGWGPGGADAEGGGSGSASFFKPPCVALHRCGGCCNSEGLQCVNTSYEYISKTLIEISVSSVRLEAVTVSFVNHTTCRCLSRADAARHSHAIIRRALGETPESGCAPVRGGAEVECGSGHLWDDLSCACVPRLEALLAPHFSYWLPDPPLAAPPARTCGPGRALDEESCACVCRRACPRRRRGARGAHGARCACACSETREGCARRGGRFHAETCSCLRAPCPRVVCVPGHATHPRSCSCVPWGRGL
ncbi:vascular endothelial growth factor C [Lampetra fluviatilis]